MGLFYHTNGYKFELLIIAQLKIPVTLNGAAEPPLTTLNFRVTVVPDTTTDGVTLAIVLVTDSSSSEAPRKSSVIAALTVSAPA